MGDTVVGVRVRSLLGRRKKPVGPVACIVDTGATLSMLPAELLARAGVRRLGRVAIELADGRTARRHYGDALVLIDGQQIPARILFARKGEPSLLGVTVLELAGLMVDPVGRRLVKRRAYQHY